MAHIHHQLQSYSAHFLATALFLYLVTVFSLKMTSKTNKINYFCCIKIMVFNFNELPDLCIITVFERLSICDLIRAGAVCRRWQKLKTTVCKKKTTLRVDNRDSWSIFAKDEIDFYGVEAGNIDVTVLFAKRPKKRAHNRLVSKYDLFITDAQSGQFVEVFSNIKRLIIVNHSLEFDITTWLCYWPKVNNLSIIGHYTIEEISVPLNRLEHLQYLIIDKSLEELNELIDISRLHGFNCRFYRKNKTVNEEKMAAMCDILNEKVTDGSNVRQVGLWFEDHSGRFDLMSSTVKSVITRITVKLDSLAQLEWICSNMSQIKYLDLEFVHKAKRSPFFQILNALSRLSDLVSLKLDVHLDDYELKHFSPTKYTEQQNFLSELASLKQIEVKIPMSPHQIRVLVKSLPNLKNVNQRVTIFNYRALLDRLCDDCSNCQFVKRELQKGIQKKLDSILFTYKNDKVTKADLFFKYLDYL